MEFAGVTVLGELEFVAGVAAMTILRELEREQLITIRNNTMHKNNRITVDLLDFFIIRYVERETLRNKVIG